MAEPKYYWLKLQDDFFKSRRIKKMRKLAGGDTFTIIYLKMQLVAMKKGGVLEYTGLEKTFADELALELDEDPDNVAITVSFLLNCGLLEETSATEYFVPYAVLNTGKESASTKRVREHRERKALHCNVDVTPVKQPCNTEKEIEIEEDKEGEINKGASDEPPLPTPPPTKGIDFGSLSPRMISVVEKWLQYKKERRESYKPTGLNALISQIENNVDRYGEDAVIELIASCMAANWRGIIFDKLKQKQQAPRGGSGGQSGNIFAEMLNEGGGAL